MTEETITILKSHYDQILDSSDCIAMIHGAFVDLGMDISATPPMMYPEAMQALLFKRLQEVGAFPGYPATVRYEPTANVGTFKRVELALTPPADVA